MDFVKDNPTVFALFLLAAILVAICVMVFCVKYVFRRRGYQDLEKGGVYEYLKSQPGYQEEEIIDSATVYVNAQMYLRSQLLYSIKKHLNDIGGRRNKNYLVVRSQDGREEKMMIMSPIGSECVFQGAGESMKPILSQILTSLKHPYLFPLSDYGYSPELNTSIAFRPISKQGSLKDIIFKASPRDFYLHKYVTSRPIASHAIPSYGRQVLEAMLYLKTCKVPFYHLHAGNVMIESNTCLITDYENTILGYPLPPYLQEGIELTGQSSEPQAVAFAFLLYEMIAGFPPESGFNGRLVFPPNSNPSVVQIIQAVLAPKSELNGLRTLEDIISHPFFAGAYVGPVNTGVPKFDSKARDLLKSVTERTRFQPAPGSRRSTIGSTRSKRGSNASLLSPQSAHSPATGKETTTAPRDYGSTSKSTSTAAATTTATTITSSPPPPPPPPPPMNVSSSSAPPPPPPPPPPSGGPNSNAKSALQEKVQASGVEGDSRNNLLASIRAGKKLRTTKK